MAGTDRISINTSGVTLTGTLTVNSLTASRVVFTNGSSQLASSASSSVLANSITDEQGTGALVFATSPTISNLTVSSGLTVTGGATVSNGFTVASGVTTLGAQGAAFSELGSCTVPWNPPNTAAGAESVLAVEMGISGNCTTANGVPADAVIIGVQPPGNSGGISCGGTGCSFYGDAMGYRADLSGAYTNSAVNLTFGNGSAVAQNPTNQTWTIWYIDP